MAAGRFFVGKPGDIFDQCLADGYTAAGIVEARAGRKLKFDRIVLGRPGAVQYFDDRRELLAGQVVLESWNPWPLKPAV